MAMQEVRSFEISGLPNQRVTSIPLVADLDGTLIKTDLFAESFLALMRQNPFYLFLFPFWLLKGKAYLKQQISRRASLDVSLLPYHQELLDHLKLEHAHGRQLVLATGTDERIAKQVADYLQIFGRVFASDGAINLSGQNKQTCLVAEFGEKYFDYAGNSRRDLAVWSSARKAILVNPTRSLSRAAAGVTEIEQIFRSPKKRLTLYLQAIRLHQWLKNLLVFVPLVMAHRFFELDLLGKTFLAFLAFGLCASSVYLVNDLLDLPSDRHHPQKRRRPFATGELSPFWGLG